jgi:hypothetical protein
MTGHTYGLPVERAVRLPSGMPLAASRYLMSGREVDKIFNIRWRNMITGIEIDVNESGAIGARVNLEQTILGFVKTLDVIKFRSFDQASSGIVRPAMITTA